MQKNALRSTGPWWKFGLVWMVFSGPAIVVVAAFATLYLAVTRPDPVISEDYYRKGIEINNTQGKDVFPAGMAPAVQGRNHAATGVVPVPTQKDPAKP